MIIYTKHTVDIKKSKLFVRYQRKINSIAPEILHKSKYSSVTDVFMPLACVQKAWIWQGSKAPSESQSVAVWSQRSPVYPDRQEFLRHTPWLPGLLSHTPWTHWQSAKNMHREMRWNQRYHLMLLFIRYRIICSKEYKHLITDYHCYWAFIYLLRSENSLDSSWHGFQRWDVGIHRMLSRLHYTIPTDISGVLLCCESSCSTTSLLDSDRVTGKATEEYWTHLSCSSNQSAATFALRHGALSCWK